MTDPREVGASEILTTAMNMVREARETVLVTMQAAEELAHPLPRDYFLLLEQKMHEGVQLIRIGFGSKEEFAHLQDQTQFSHSNYRFYPTESTDYRRMLLVDNKKMLFAKTDADGRHVFYTEDPRLIADLKTYAQTFSV